MMPSQNDFSKVLFMMYLPSFFSGALISKFGPLKIIKAGFVLMLGMCFGMRQGLSGCCECVLG